MNTIENTILLVKYRHASGAWNWQEYPCKRSRDLKNVQKYFFAQKYDVAFIYVLGCVPKTYRRNGTKVGYIDRRIVEYYPHLPKSFRG